MKCQEMLCTAITDDDALIPHVANSKYLTEILEYYINRHKVKEPRAKPHL